jgi:hypothetical protein
VQKSTLIGAEHKVFILRVNQKSASRWPPDAEFEALGPTVIQPSTRYEAASALLQRGKTGGVEISGVLESGR